MILSFSQDQFRDRILDGTKIHTIRQDRTERWKPGMVMHMWRGNPRNVSKNPKEFCTRYRLVSKQEIFISPKLKQVQITVDGDKKTVYDMIELALNDGFDDEQQFWDYFTEDFKGYILHWTDYQYRKQWIY